MNANQIWEWARIEEMEERRQAAQGRRLEAHKTEAMRDEALLFSVNHNQAIYRGRVRAKARAKNLGYVF